MCCQRVLLVDKVSPLAAGEWTFRHRCSEAVRSSGWLACHLRPMTYLRAGAGRQASQFRAALGTSWPLIMWSLGRSLPDLLRICLPSGLLRPSSSGYKSAPQTTTHCAMRNSR